MQVNGFCGSPPCSFPAGIEAFDGTTLLGSFQETGITNMNEDNSAIFLGVKSSSQNITSLAFCLFCGQHGIGDPGFLVNQLSIDTKAIPEPPGMLLLFSGLVALCVILLRRKQVTGK
jgi:hypothetical protein